MTDISGPREIILYYTRIKFHAQVGFFTNLSLMTNTATNPFPLTTMPITAANYDDCFYQRLYIFIIFAFI